MNSHRWFSRIASLLFLSSMLASLASAEWKEKVLYSFQGGHDGAVPAGGVVFDKAGNLYGATADGGSGCTVGSCGTVFQLVPPLQKGSAWRENVLHNFQGLDQGDGSSPEGGLLMDAEGNLYGTTGYGGTGGCVLIGSKVGCGTVYEMAPPKQKGGKWTEKILYSFLGDKDGQFPWGDLVFDTGGNLYGATQFGGGFGSCDDPFYQHCGTVFELVAPRTNGGKWTEKVLYSFKSGKDGAGPNGGLIFDSKGVIYGTTYDGGNQICEGGGFIGCGTVFELQPTNRGAWSETILRRFQAGMDGALPVVGLVSDTARNLYGTTTNAGEHEEGVLFKLTPPRKKGDPWTETILHSFTGGRDGAVPGQMLFDSSGKLYGVARGGNLPGGVVFRLTLQQGNHWNYAVLYNLAGPPDGKWPQAAPVFDGKGSLYGVTLEGGTGQSCQEGCGTVFEILP